MRTIIIPELFKIGELYSNFQIHTGLSVSNSGGIRPSVDSQNKLNYIVLFTSHEENRTRSRNPYADQIEGDILTYTAAGLRGEQYLTGVNKRIVEQIDNPVPILGFSKEGVNAYRFIGFLFLLRHYQDYQLDQEGRMRKVIVFEFKILTEINEVNISSLSQFFLPLFHREKEKIVVGDSEIDLLPINENATEEVEKLRNLEVLKSKLMGIDPYRFEKISGKLIAHTGFTNIQITKKSGDDGIDVNATFKIPLSSDLHYAFQIKRWKHSVGRNEVANLRGSMGLNTQGVIISTSYFTKSAIEEARSPSKTPIHLVGMEYLYTVIKDTSFPIEEYF